MRISRALAAATAPLVLAPAFALATATPAAADALQTVTVMLRTPDPAGLAAAAGAPGARVSRTSRATRAAALRPSAAQRAQVVATLGRLGLRVTDVRAWSVRASAPRSVVQAVFGSARSVRPHLRRAAALPHVPASLGGLVTGVFGGDETRPAAYPKATYDYTTAGLHGDDLHDAYGAQPAAVPAAPPAADAATIATVQLSGWRASDLTAYAAAAGMPYDPVATGQVTMRPVDGANPSTIWDPSGADEVALDQEALLAAAPGARQRAYFASSNTPDGFADAIYAVGDDASDNARDGYHLTALSISWGACEDALDSPDDPYYQTLQQALAYVVATGVTVFAASGDDGADDCASQPNATAPNSPAVDFPASSPFVVAVGGTSLVKNGTTWSETAWSGSGGGESILWKRPSWQPGSGALTQGRRVPDISVVADPSSPDDSNPATGFAAYLGPDGWQPVGGTSLGAPVAAGLLTHTLVAHGYSRGIGEVHPALYAAPSSAFRDVTSGANGQWTAGPGYDEVTGLGSPLWETLQPSLVGDPHVRLVDSAGNGVEYTNSTAQPVNVSVSAPSWYPFTSYVATVDIPTDGDPCASKTPVPSSFTPSHTGWNEIDVAASDGTYCHVGAAAVLVDTKPPVVTRIAARQIVPTSAALAFSWAGADASSDPSDPSLASGLRDYAFRIFQSGLAKPIINWTYTTATSYTKRDGLVAGATYWLEVVARDRAGNLSNKVGAKVTVPIDDRAFRFSGGGTWVRRSHPAAYGASWATSARRGAGAQVTAVGRRYVAWLTYTRDGGKVGFYVGSTLVATVDTYSPTTRARVPVVVYTSPTAARRTITMHVLGQRNRYSQGYNVTVDALQPVL